MHTKATFGLGVCVWRLAFFFSFFLARVCETCSYCSCTVQWTVAVKFDFSHFFQPISAHHALFIDLQISFFSNFFIKNRSHGTIHTFKNYFATVFFSFQFSIVSKRTLIHSKIYFGNLSKILKWKPLKITVSPLFSQ